MKRGTETAHFLLEAHEGKRKKHVFVYPAVTKDIHTKLSIIKNLNLPFTQIKCVELSNDLFYSPE